VRLHKMLAAAGVCSRRHAEELIAAGRVSVNGVVVTEQGQLVAPDRVDVAVDGKPILLPEGHVYILMHKPRATICSAADPEGRQRVFDLIRERLPRLHTVGRLDFQTTGALLITNDGRLTAALSHPSRRIERVYDIKLRRELSAQALVALWEGVTLDTGEKAERVWPQLMKDAGHAFWYRLTLHEGRNREVRRMFEAVSAEVQKLHRAAFAGLLAATVPPGRYRFLERDEVRALFALAGLTDTPHIMAVRPLKRRFTRGPNVRPGQMTGVPKAPATPARGEAPGPVAARPATRPRPTPTASAGKPTTGAPPRRRVRGGDNAAPAQPPAPRPAKRTGAAAGKAVDEGTGGRRGATITAGAGRGPGPKRPPRPRGGATPTNGRGKKR